MNFYDRCGTRAYMAPEILFGKEYTEVVDLSCINFKSVDIWSCGIIAYHLLAGALPFYDKEEMTD